MNKYVGAAGNGHKQGFVPRGDTRTAETVIACQPRGCKPHEETMQTEFEKMKVQILKILLKGQMSSAELLGEKIAPSDKKLGMAALIELIQLGSVAIVRRENSIVGIPDKHTAVVNGLVERCGDCGFFPV